MSTLTPFNNLVTQTHTILIAGVQVQIQARYFQACGSTFDHAAGRCVRLHVATAVTLASAAQAQSTLQLAVPSQPLRV